MLRTFVLASFFVLNLLAVAWAAPVKLVVLGDSLSAGYQLPPDTSFPDQLQKALRKKGYEVDVVNAGVSGDTTSGGLARVDWSVGQDADAVIVELGANDMLRGIKPELTRNNLDQLLKRLKERNLPVLLTGMKAQRNLGPEYAAAFDPIYSDLAKKYQVLFYPFFLKGVALKPDLNQSDGMHPNPKGVSVVVNNMLPKVEELLKRVSSSS